MTRSVLVLGVAHELQGPKFRGYVQDPSYCLFVEGAMYGVDFVFEEASGLSPSHAEDLANAALGSGHYLDFDPPRSERAKHGIPENTTGGGPIDPMRCLDSYSTVLVPAQEIREKFWAQRIKQQPFTKAIAIVGIAHSLSLAFRLASLEMDVDEIRAYTPYDKLCRRKHA